MKWAYIVFAAFLAQSGLLYGLVKLPASATPYFFAVLGILATYGLSYFWSRQFHADPFAVLTIASVSSVASGAVFCAALKAPLAAILGNEFSSFLAISVGLFGFIIPFFGCLRPTISNPKEE